jgi:hypothetical protein
LKIIIADDVETTLNLHRRYPGLVLDLRARRDKYAEMLDWEPTYFWVQTPVDEIVAQQLLATIERGTVYVIGSKERCAEIQPGEGQKSDHHCVIRLFDGGISRGETLKTARNILPNLPDSEKNIS